MAFPVTSVLDNFNRADTGPPPSASWTSDVLVGAGGMKVVSNAVTENSGTGDGWWNAAQFGPDQEVYMTLASGGVSSRLYLQLANPGTLTVNGYMIWLVASDDLRIYRITSGGLTKLGATETTVWSSGDSIGASISGGVITIYQKTAGVWGVVTTRSDATYSATSYIGMSIGAGTADDFGGGTLSVGTPPEVTVVPAVTGTTTVGQTLSATTGTWTDDGSPTYTYQWQRDTGGNLSFSNIGGATASTYVLVDADDGNKVRCRVTDTDGVGATTSSSNAVGLIVEPVPVNSVAPVASGSPNAGATVSSTTGTWTHQGGGTHTYAYQWQDSANGTTGWANLSGKTSSSYVVQVGEVGKYLRCQVTAHNSGGDAASATPTNVLGPVAAGGPTNTVAPAVTGTATVGQTLTSDNGTWTDDGSPAFTYQWQRDVAGDGNFSNIASATASTRVLVDADDGNKIRCVVTNTDTSGVTAANSNAAGLIIEPKPTNSVAPVASGHANIRSTVGSSTGTWTHQAGSLATYQYQWQSSADGSTSWGDISGKTSATYSVEAGQSTKYLRCNVKATNTGGQSTSATATNVLGPVGAARPLVDSNTDGAPSSPFFPFDL